MMLINDDRCSDNKTKQKKYEKKHVLLEVYLLRELSKFLYPFIFSTLYREDRVKRKVSLKRQTTSQAGRKQKTKLFLCVHRIAIHIKGAVESIIYRMNENAEKESRTRDSHFPSIYSK